MRIHKGLLQRLPMAAILLDEGTCFDQWRLEFLMDVVRMLGMAAHVGQACSHFCKQQSRAWKLWRHDSEQWQSANGVSQGCSLSLLFTTLMFSALERHINRFAPGVAMQVYVDDKSIFVTQLAGDFPDEEMVARPAVEAIVHAIEFLPVVEQ